MSSWESMWEEVYRNQEWGMYPPEELIRFLARNYHSKSFRRDVRILDVGCGTGAGTWFVAREVFYNVGIDGSNTAISKAKKRFTEESLSGNFIVGDIEHINFMDNSFDAVIDIVAVQHNKYTNIINIVEEGHRVLKPGGKFFSMMVENGSYGYGLGSKIDKNSFTQIAEGSYLGKGIGHFTDIDELNEIFSIFEYFDVECSIRTINYLKDNICHYIISAEK